MLRINQTFNKSMKLGTEMCLLSSICPKLTAYKYNGKKRKIGYG